MSKRNNKIKFNNCNICSSKKLEKVIDLGYHTQADTFIHKKYKDLILPKTRLICNYCKNCLQIQLGHTLVNQYRYNEFKYSYTSSNSSVSRNYLNEYFYFVKKNINYPNNNILEIGSNDGFLLNKFKNKKSKLFAYEISSKMHSILKKKKINSINLPFEEISKFEIQSKLKKFDTIICNNVLNHCHNLNKFFKNINSILSDTGIFFLEVPYAPWMIEKSKFELIYLEHINYFSLNGLSKLSTQNNLYINKVNFFNYHGKMIRLCISKRNKIDKKLKTIISKEKKYFSSKMIFRYFMETIENKKTRFLNKIMQIKLNQNSKIVAVGAGAKTISLINYFNLNNKYIDFLTDNSKLKISKYVPNRNIEIKPDMFIKKHNNVYAFFPTWNISKFLKIKIRKINKNIKFISY